MRQSRETVSKEATQRLHDAIVGTRPEGLEEAVLTGWVVGTEWALPNGQEAVAITDGPDGTITHVRKLGLVEYMRNKLRREA